MSTPKWTNNLQRTGEDYYWAEDADGYRDIIFLRAGPLFWEVCFASHEPHHMTLDQAIESGYTFYPVPIQPPEET